MAELAGRVAVVTGGTGALGREVCRALGGAGAAVYVPYIVENEAADLQADLGPQGLVCRRADVSRAAEVQAFVDAVVAEQGRVDILVNGVGGFWGGVPASAVPESEWDRMLTLNLKTAFLVARAVIPHMERTGWGRIVNVASRAAFEPAPGLVAYSVAKAGVAALTRALAAELRETGITVNAVAPSTMDTPANRSAMPDADPSRWVKPAEVAAAILWLAGPAAGATSGAIVPVYGRA